MKEKRTLIIGDIHGHQKALKDVLAKANFNIDEDRLICLGDYVDGWDESFEVVRTLLEIKNQSKFDNVFLMGNHDKWFLDVLNNDLENFRNEQYIKRKYDFWYTQGGKATYESYLNYSDEFIKIHKRDFFDQLKYYHLENNKLFVHAGFDLGIGFERTLKHRKEELIWDRNLYRTVLDFWLRNQNLKRKGKTIRVKKIEGFDKIYIGHTPTISNGISKPQIMANVINLDQGCKKRGVLTAWVDETNTFFQNV